MVPLIPPVPGPSPTSVRAYLPLPVTTGHCGPDRGPEGSGRPPDVAHRLPPQACAPPGDPPHLPYLHHRGAATPSERDRTNRSHRGLVPGVLPARPARRVTVPGPAPPRRAAGQAPSRAVQQERERVALLAGQRGCRLDQLPDPGIQGRVRVACGVPVVVGRSPRRLSAAGLELAGRDGCPAGLASAVLVSRCGADPLARMN